MVSFIRWNLSFKPLPLKKLLLIVFLLVAADRASAQSSGSSHTVTLKLESIVVVQDFTSQTNVASSPTLNEAGALANNSITKTMVINDKKQVVSISNLDNIQTEWDKTSSSGEGTTKVYTVSKL
jgi:hypothetical protein